MFYDVHAISGGPEPIDARLQPLNRRYDPDNVFHGNRNIVA